MRRTVILVMLIASVLAWDASWAGRENMVDNIALQDGFIVVGDSQIWLSDRTVVYTPTGSRGSLQMLRKGQTIQYQLDNTAARRTASEIWIMSGN